MIKKLLTIFLTLFTFSSQINAQFVLDESFAGGTFPPSGWLRGPALDDSGNPVWVRSNASGYANGNGSAFCYFYNWPAPGTDSLTTPAFSATGASDTLYFDHAYRSYGTENDNLKVYYSTNEGGSWVLLQDLPGGATVGTGMVTATPSTSNFLNPTAVQWATKKYLLPAGVNKIKFEVITAYGNNLFLDNVKVGKPAAVDAAATNLLLPSSAIFTSTTISNLRGVTQNNSASAQTISIRRTINPGGYSSTKTLNNVAAGATDTATFDPWTFVDGTVYTVRDSIILAGDASVINDAIQANFAPATVKDILIVNADAVSKDSLIAHLAAAGLGNKYNESPTIPTVRFDAWKTIFVLLPSGSGWSAALRDSMKTFLDGATPSNKKSLGIWGNDLGYQFDPLRNVSATVADTVFYRQYLRAQYWLDNWLTSKPLAARKYSGTAPSFAAVTTDSIADLFPDLVKPVNGGLAAFIPLNLVGTDSVNAVYFDGPNYKVFYGTNQYSSYKPLNYANRPTTAIINFLAAQSLLPVNITAFKAYQSGIGIAVEWHTTSELNMHSYEVEHSQNGLNFTKMGTVAAKNGLINQYNWFDAKPFDGVNYYRVKTIGLDGATKYTSIVKVAFGKGKQAVSVYPNPVKGNSISLAFSHVEKGNYTISVYNMQGQLMVAKVLSHAGGSASQTIQLPSTLISGLYNLVVTGTQLHFNQKLILE
jgi:hypothetical protein